MKIDRNQTTGAEDPESLRRARKEKTSPQTKGGHDDRPWFASDDEKLNGVGIYPAAANPSAPKTEDKNVGKK